MKMVEDFKGWLAKRQEEEAAKAAAGVFVSRPVLNGAEWAAWAAGAGVPSPKAAADLHVTIISSDVPVLMIPDESPMVIDCMRGAFAMLGPDEDAFAFAFSNWQLQDRHWTYQENGAVSSWPTYRAHMTLSSGAKGFELDPATLASAPRYIMLGGEVTAPKKADAPDDADAEGVEGEAEDQAIIVVIDIAMSAAKKALEEGSDTLSPIDQAALYDISKGRPVTVGVAKRLVTVSEDVCKALAAAPAERPAAEARKRVEHDVTLKITPAAAEAIKSAKLESEVLKTDDERRLIYAISNVYSIGGQTVEDLDGDGFTTSAMEEFTAELLKKDTSGTFEHEGPLCNTVVQGIVMSDELQKALGIDLGFEALITATHFPDDENWAKAKEGQWEQSIRGRFWWFDEEGGA